MFKVIMRWLSLFFFCFNSIHSQVSGDECNFQQITFLRLIAPEISEKEKIFILQNLLQSENSLYCQLALFCVGKEKIAEECIISCILDHWEKYGYFEICTGIWVFGQLEKSESRMIRCLLFSLLEEEFEIQRNATSALNKLGFNSKEDLLQLIKNLDWNLEKQQIERVLNVFNWAQKRNAQVKCVYLNFDFSELRKFWKPIYKFLKHYSATEELVDILLKSFKIPVLFYNVGSLEMLDQIENLKFSVELKVCLLEQLGKESRKIRETALKLLKKLDYQVNAIIPSLKKALDEKQIFVTESTLWTVEILGFEETESLEILLIGLEDNEATGYLANKLLKKLKPTDKNVPILINHFNQKNLLGRIRLSEWFGEEKLGRQKKGKKLQRLLEEEENDLVKALLAQALD